MGAILGTIIEALQLAAIPAHDEALRPAVRAFLDEALREMPADRRARSWMGHDAEFSRALARQGWLGLTLPVEYGGAGRSNFARFVLSEELLAVGAPVSAHWVADRQTAPLILRFGSPAQRAFYLPRIIRGEAFFAIGMSEPDTGSDLASVRTRATPVADGWLLNGRKIWTTNAHRSHYMCALVRTSGAPEDRHRGLSQMIFDLALPGIEIRPIRDIAGDAHFCEVLFDNVLLPHDALVGEEGSGWRQVMAELALERSGPERIYSSMVLLDGWLAHLRCDAAPQRAQVCLAGRLAARLAVLRSMSLAVSQRLEQGADASLAAVLVKDLGTEFEQAVPELIGQALHASPQPAPDDVLMRTLAYLTLINPTFSLRGGTRHILRGIIARELGLR
ncbi:acyl-CoA dehydrogenase [Bordetella pertussis]|uniref:Acyl-CoA dehydrogenase fadE12 n=1 Tax=Bordetella pertussis TaxID=520 RepID=A0A0E8E850_BORPT|nr:acyl-CoA dehydrogenase family protein [Bordetella pertussis]ALX22751.1 acyl-CoA dehydrogenase [Bordetella pertussis]ALX23784.1 acyl-CoA dehydrogenase [Bordetella pertussis]AMG23465.1 acyl-CoA dehydrogenase [Bordetella pertussis]AMS52748.1 acyl-CoA dehydrogenase [Bordetella pertussis]AMS56382.1 acyl-CoA dehydrogenase [Bordetella pertussis]